MKNGTNVGQLIFSKIIKIVATSCEILRRKYTKFDFGRGAAGWAYGAPPDLKLDFRGPRGEEKRQARGKGTQRKGEKREERRGRENAPSRLPVPLQLAAAGDAVGPYAA